MREATIPKYLAFLSYSHNDRAFARWLHHALESYRIDSDLAGRETSVGTIPKTLRPIFRDRDDFAAGHSLTAQTIAALEASEFLIVLCSPSAARSRYVDAEVRHFKSMGRVARVIPVIIEGEPGDSEDECFPPSVQFKFAPDGTQTDEREEPIAADARSGGDGREAALQKVVAGLLGVSLDQVMHRAERARKRRYRSLAAVAALFLCLALAATASAVFAYQKLLQSEERLDQAIEIAYGFVSEAASLSDRFGIPADMTLGLLGRAENALAELISRGADTETLRYRKALMLMSFSDSYEMLGQTDEALNRSIEGKALLTDLAEGGQIDRRLSFVRVMLQAGQLYEFQLDSGSALAVYEEALAAATGVLEDDPRNVEATEYVARSRIGVGDALMQRGSVSDAGAIYVDALNSILEFATGSPDGDFGLIADRYPELSEVTIAATDRFAHLQTLRGMFTEALRYRQGLLPYRDGVARLFPESVWAQWGSLDAHVQIANLLLETGKIDEARAGFERALSIGERLSDSDPRNVSFRRLVAIATDGIGRTHLAVGDVSEALEVFRRNIEIGRPFIEGDPGNLMWRGNLAIGHERVGDALMLLGDYDAAIAEYRAMGAIIAELRDRDVDEIATRFAISQFKVGDALFGQRRLTEAESSYRDGLAHWVARAQAGDNQVIHSIYLFQTMWRLSQIGGDLASFRNARNGLKWFQDKGMLGNSESRWLAIAEAHLAEHRIGGVSIAAIDCLEIEDPDKSIGACSQAIQLAENEQSADLGAMHKIRGDAYRAKDMLKEALSDYDISIAIDSRNAGSYNNRGLAHLSMGKLDLAIADMNRALSLAGESAIVYFNRGLVYEAASQPERALADFELALKIDPTLDAGIEGLARLRAAQSEP